MSLNIKNEEVHDLVRQLAELTHQTQTSAVEEAVRLRLDELRRESDAQARTERIMAIGRRTAVLMTPEQKKLLNGDWLYDDETGLPK